MCWGRGSKRCTVPDQLVVDKELEFRVKVGKTNTEGGPVVGREHREEVVHRRTVSTTHKHTGDEVKSHMKWYGKKTRYGGGWRKRDIEHIEGKGQVERKGERRLM